ncbi:hypothetical protein QFZ66_008157 [Streptomyces sp. B4I13]|uniref:hypothetical protein n=1 Tax=Streptomyces sp. B4I13 TaxID=3042271 RepID=UPI002785186F|nr:hypothetical protein [Streptomyces sp. B4I13]MDQ0964279.1 hypothetical protein [Streptomyces sp. B4I13]
MNATPSRPTGETAGPTDEELARRVAELATSWVSADTPLSQDRRWDLVGLQNAGSAQGEMHAFDRLGAWQRQLVHVLASADDSEEGRARVRAARSEAVSQMRDMLLTGIRSAESLDNSLSTSTRRRAQLRSFIGRHDRTTGAAERAAIPTPTTAPRCATPTKEPS